MKRVGLSGLSGLLAVAVLGVAASAGPDRVKLPENYQQSFVNYLDVDRYDRLGVRKMWVNPEAHEAAQAGEPLPDGTVLIMELHAARTDADGNPVHGEDGRLVADPEVGHRFVMEKNSDWSTRNGNWDYAWYQPDGSARPDANFDGCFACHDHRAGRDYTFTYFKFLEDAAN